MKPISRKTPEGTRDLLFEESTARGMVTKRLSKIFEQRGYHEVVTPVLEYYDLFTRDAFGIQQESMYKLTDHRGRLLAMRPDSTVPIARLVSTRLKDAVLPIRLFYSQNVFRASPLMSGHNDEIMQSGVELIGVKGKRADLEMVVTAAEALKACEVSNFRIELGHAGFFRALAKRLDVDDERLETIRLSIESKNYAALGDLLDKLEKNEATAAMRQLPRLFGGEEVFEQATALCQNNKEALEHLTYLHQLYSDLVALGLENCLSIDLGLVHRNDYYTGVVFCGYIEGSGVTALSGGRYDSLFDEFGLNLPAIGFAVENDVLAQVMCEGAVPQEPVKTVVFGESGFEGKALECVKNLTQQGKICEYAACETAEQAMALAASRGADTFMIVAENIQTIPVERSAK